MGQVKIKKFLLILVTALLLVGCSAENDAQKILDKALALPPAQGTNQSKGILKYYLSPDMGVKASTQTSTLIVYDQVEMMLSIKVSDIVYNFYKEDEGTALSSAMFDKGDSIDGVYLDQNNKQERYVYNEVVIDDQIALTLDNGLVSIVSLIRPIQKESVLTAMMSILRSSQVKLEEVVSLYSNKEIIQYNTIHREFFEQEVPESGSLIDMYNQMNPDDKIE